MNEKREANAWQNTYGDLGQAGGPRLMQLPLALLDPWCGSDGQKQPFRMYSPEKLRELAENIQENGIIEPVRVRPHGGRFQILGGHNRCAAARLAGMTTVPALMEEVDDTQARKLMIDSNLKHRERLLPSELAAAYKMRWDDTVGRQGYRSDTSPQVAAKFRTDDDVARELGISADTMLRYMRLNDLLPAFLDMVDEGTVGITVGVELSFLSSTEQEAVLEVMRKYGIRKISGKQAKALRYTQDLQREDIVEILGAGPKTAQLSPLKITLDTSKLPSRIPQMAAKDPAFLAYLQQMAEKYLLEVYGDTSPQST